MIINNNNKILGASIKVRILSGDKQHCENEIEMLVSNYEYIEIECIGVNNGKYSFLIKTGDYVVL